MSDATVLPLASTEVFRGVCQPPSSLPLEVFVGQTEGIPLWGQLPAARMGRGQETPVGTGAKGQVCSAGVKKSPVQGPRVLRTGVGVLLQLAYQGLGSGG